MGVLDLLKRRPRPGADESVTFSEPGATQDDSADANPAMRGDFMLLPPLRPTFGTPARLQHSLDDFLVTHRPTTVTTEPLAHEIDPQRLGMVAARGRRSVRPRPRRDALVHRQSPEEPEFEDFAPELPPPPAPRRLSASTPPASRTSRPSPTVGSLPSVAEVHHSVSAPSIRIRVPDAVESSEEFDAVRAASRMENSTEAPIVRRRGGASPANPVDSSPVSPPPAASADDLDIDLDALQAPSAADMPEIKGSARVRGALPPSSSAGTRPLLGVDKADDAVPAPASREVPSTEPLQHRAASSSGTDAPELAPGAALAATAASAPSRSEATSVPSSISGSSDLGTGDATVAPAPAQPRAVRSLLGAQPSITAASPRTSTAVPTGAPTPGSTGRTGVQRKARSQSARPVAKPPVASAPPAASVPPSTVTSAPVSGGMSRSDSTPETEGAPSSAGTSVAPAAPSSERGVARPPAAPELQALTPAPRADAPRAPGAPTDVPPHSSLAATPTTPPSATTVPGASTTSPAGTVGTPLSASSPAADAPSDSSTGTPDTPSGAGAAPAARAVPIPAEVRRAVAAATGDSPDTVMIHQGAHADSEADVLNAEAFTRDGEIYLPGDASLDTPRGQALLAHELTHVVQQRGGTERMPDESSREGRAHEEQALKVERALAKPAEASAPESLEHAGGSEARGSAPANVPQGVQRRGRELGAINGDSSDSDSDSDLGLPPVPEPAIAHASPLQPSVLDQVALVHAGQAPPLREADAAAASKGLGSQAKALFNRGMFTPGVQKIQPGKSTKYAPPSEAAPVSGAGASGGVSSESGAGAGSSGGSGGVAAPASSGDEPKPEPGAKDKAVNYFSRMMSSPSAPEAEDVDDRRGQLERQADSLYPYLRSRLRAELVRDRDRRGRLTREWR